MHFKVKLVPLPGDQSYSRALVRVADASGAFLDGQVILEGEKIETDVAISAGQTVEITELERPTVFDMEQKAAVLLDLTPDDKLKKRMETPTTPEPKDHDKHSSASMKR